MKPFWRQPYRDDFLERAGLYLLYAFILSIAANPFIMYFVGLDKFNYVTIESYSGDYHYFSPAQQEIISKYKVVDQSFVDRQREFESYIEWITITALLGWCVTSPRFMRGWPKLVQKIKDSY